MTDIDELLSIIENPTRRRILECLTREPSYPLQLSKELGISQQAVMKNLALMEQTGMLMSHPEVSDRGPSRTVYVPSRQFTLMIDLHDNMFTARLISEEMGSEPHTEEIEGMDEAIGLIKELDSRIHELEEERSKLLQERNSVMSWFNQTVRSIDDTEKRSELYRRLEDNIKDDTKEA